MLNADYLPRAFLVEHARFFDSYEDILAYMGTGEFDPGGEVLLLGSPEQTLSDRGADSPGRVARSLGQGTRRECLQN